MSAGDALAREGLALREGREGVGFMDAEEEKEGCEMLAWALWAGEEEAKGEGLALTFCVTEKDREALAVEEREAREVDGLAEAEAEKDANDMVASTLDELLEEAAALVLALALALPLADARALLEAEREG